MVLAPRVVGDTDDGYFDVDTSLERAALVAS